MNLWHIRHDKRGYHLCRSDRDWWVKCNDLAMAHDLCDLLNASVSYGSPSSRTQFSIPDLRGVIQLANSTAR